MKFVEIKNAITYIKNRPMLCEALADCLVPYLQDKEMKNGMRGEGGDRFVDFLTPPAVGKLIGKSGSWVRKHIDIFEAISDDNGRWYIPNWVEEGGYQHVGLIYSNYIQRRLLNTINN